MYRVDFGVPCGNSSEIGSSGGGFSRVMLANCGRGIIFGHEADLLDNGAAAFLNAAADEVCSSSLRGMAQGNNCEDAILDEDDRLSISR